MTPRITTHATVRSPKIRQPLTLAVMSDLHNGPYADALEEACDVDAILLVGDLLDRHHPGLTYAKTFLEDAPKVAPTFYAVGNHEWKSVDRPAFWPMVEKSDVTVLDNRWIEFGGICLGGFSSAEKKAVDSRIVDDLARQEGFRLLMCHHPEWYGRYIRGKGIDLTLSGHAHGGQVQLFGHGLYAPGQGPLPRWTHGFYYDGHLLVSRGMTNACTYPRWFNPCEMIILHLMPGEEYSYEIRA